MLPSDVFLAAGSKQHARPLSVCFRFPQEHTWQTRPKERTMHPTPTRPSSTPRATTHTQKRRKNTSFRLQRELCSSSSPLLASVSVALSPVFLLHLCPPSWQWGTRRLSMDREVSKIFSCYCFSLSQFLSCTSCSWFSVLAASFHRQLTFLVVFLFFDIQEICISTMTASYITPCQSSLLFPSKQTSKHIMCPLRSHTSTNTYHVSHQHGA